MHRLDRLRAAALQIGGQRTVPIDAIEDLLLLGGWTIPAPGARAAVRRTIDALADSGELVRDAAGRFDPSEAVNLMIVAGLAGTNDFWRDHYVVTGRSLVAGLCGGSPGWPPDPATLAPRDFAVGVTRIFHLLPAIRAGRWRLRLPLPVEDVHLIGLAVECDDMPAPPAFAPGRIEVTAAGGAATVTLRARYRFRAHAGLPHGAAESPDGHGRWLAAREGAIRVTPAVRALASRIAGGERDAERQVALFRDHIFDHFACGVVPPDPVERQSTPDRVLANDWFDCRIGSALLVALCRARGIAARLVGGYLLWAAPTEHYWVEAWLPGKGWTPYDLLAWDLSAGGRDPAWRDVYAGAVDYRMKTQVFPDIFTGAPGIGMAAPWHRLPQAIPGGTRTRFVAAADGRPLYTEDVVHLTE